MSSIATLPTELLLEIISLCSFDDLKRLVQTCRNLHETLIPEIYYKVDLSSHNDGPQRRKFKYHDNEMVRIDMDGCSVPRDITKRQATKLDKKVFHKQKLFIQTMQRSPELGRHVRELHWTVLDASDQFWGALENEEQGPSYVLGENDTWKMHGDTERQSFSQDKPPKVVYAPEDEPIWEAFRGMIHVKAVDLCWIREWREVTLPGPLFESATSIKLGGRMTLEFVHCILGGPERASSVGPRIEHLHLNSIIEWSGTDVPLPKFDHLGELSEYYDSHRDNDFVVEPNRGMLAGVVDPLIGHCTALTSLHITTSAETTDASLTETYEDGLFKSWANLIRSTRNGLTKLVFEHIRVARHDFWDWPCSKGTILHPHFGRQIDKMFFFHILPVLVEGPWPRMKHMEFRGVGLRKAGNYTRRPPSEEALTVPYIDYTVTDRDSRRAPYKVCQIVNAFPTDAREQVARLMDEAAELVVCEYRRGVDVDRLLGETGIPSHGRVPVHSGSDME